MAGSEGADGMAAASPGGESDPWGDDLDESLDMDL